jgi:hypothetical protein
VTLRLVPISIRGASEYVARWHRHSAVPRGALFALSCATTGSVEPCGVAMVGRPVARKLQDGRTCEVIRVATDGTHNACSFLYGAAKRAAQAMGYVRCITYTLASENGGSLRAIGAVQSGTVKGASWDSPSRRRTDKTASQRQDKVRWTLFDMEAA